MDWYACVFGVKAGCTIQESQTGKLCPSIPKSPAGKILRKYLRKMVLPGLSSRL
ncbi:hypothetical protein Tsubulata_024843 [Turnera subulata]|uniref:Uncharacterized protein n=1 Tax=Turnera subulata TaxID=218843 RepID=A0A9Q0F5W4_9ROSI|nr:hypothetical protein Tsubulata_024843 [Turnera subulata]